MGFRLQNRRRISVASAERRHLIRTLFLLRECATGAPMLSLLRIKNFDGVNSAKSALTNMLTEGQQSNYKMARDLLECEGLPTLRQVADRDFRKLSSRFKCIHCGHQVSSMSVKYFDYDIMRVLCYECQRNNISLTNQHLYA